MNPLPVAPAYRLAEQATEQRWLGTGLWSAEAVGIIGGEPKCCKSFLALDLAVSVAAGTPCLRRFAVPNPGCVLLYAAEDAPHIVRHRLDGICAAAGLNCEGHGARGGIATLVEIDRLRRRGERFERAYTDEELAEASRAAVSATLGTQI